MAKFDFSKQPLPIPYEAELLTILMEECAEVQQRAAKILRFGAGEVQPGQSFNNVERLSRELGELAHIVDLLEQRLLVSNVEIQKGREIKARKLPDWMQHWRE